MNENVDKNLVRQCLSGKKEAFDMILNKYEKLVFNVAYRMTGNFYDSEDITQTVFMKVYENLDSFNPRHKFYSWIYRICVNETLNFLNKNRRSTDLDSGIISPDKTPEDKLNETETKEMIQDALMDMAPNYKILIILKHLQGFSYREIAYIVDLPEKKIKSRLFTARNILRDILSKKGAF
jgi:RNA polymerase sigma-70 factor (ECF subfamily)